MITKQFLNGSFSEKKAKEVKNDLIYIFGKEATKKCLKAMLIQFRLDFNDTKNNEYLRAANNVRKVINLIDSGERAPKELCVAKSSNA